MRAKIAMLSMAAALAFGGASTALADNAANKARATLSECLKALPADRLSDEKAISDCLERAQGAAEQEDKRRGQIEFQRQLDQMDRMIERTTRGGRFP
jgi:hypothetical protein